MSGAAAAAAAARKRRLAEQEEEERLTNYSANDVEGWEFKIVRSATGAFSKREAVEQLRRREAAAGWEMIEKFDNSRIRFKRRIERRANDQHLAVDPYATTFGMGEGALVSVIIVGAFVVVGLVLLITFLVKGQ